MAGTHLKNGQRKRIYEARSIGQRSRDRLRKRYNEKVNVLQKKEISDGKALEAC